MLLQHDETEHLVFTSISPPGVDHNFHGRRRQLRPVSNYSSNKAVCSVTPQKHCRDNLESTCKITAVSLDGKTVGTFQFFSWLSIFGGIL